MTAVSTSPAIIPRIGFENIVRILVNFSFSASGATAPLIVSIPNIRIANPTRMFPMSFFLLLSFAVMISTIPIAANTGENDVGFKSCINRLDPRMPDSERIHEVTVVPTFAPMMMPTACESCIIPEFTNPTTMTVVADEDWITAVTAIPRSTAIIRFEVSFSKICSSLPPDNFARPSPIASIPYRNIARPPIIVRTLNMFILSLLYTLCRQPVHSK